MEIGLSKRNVKHFTTVMDTVKFCEETMETIVPDSLPDAVHVLETQGVVMIRSKEISDGRASVNGVVELTAVYAPEGNGAAKRITQSIPFKAICDGADVDTQCELVADARLVNGEMRLLNPRKMLGKVNVAVSFTVYAPREMEVTEGVNEVKGIETLVTPTMITYVCSVNEGTISLSDSMEFGGGKPTAKELLGCRVRITPEECKFVGAKGIVKGKVGLDVLYLTEEDSGVSEAYFELPFTQIIELEQEAVDPRAQVKFALTGYSVELDEEMSGRGISAAFYITSQTVVSEKQTLYVLEDLYSTEADTDVSFASFGVTTEEQCAQVRKSVRETIETSTAAISVASVKIDVNSVIVDSSKMSAKATVVILYVDENNRLLGTEKQITVDTEIALGSGQSICSLEVYEEQGTYALPTADGVELRAELVFDYCVCTCANMTAVESALIMDEKTDDTPSAVLCSVHGEPLWDVAKRYRTSPQAIAAINSIQGDMLPDDGRLLLIPKKRA